MLDVILSILGYFAIYIFSYFILIILFGFDILLEGLLMSWIPDMLNNVKVTLEGLVTMPLTDHVS